MDKEEQMNSTQIKIDKYLSAAMQEASDKLDALMESEASNEMKIRMAPVYGARWSVLNDIRNFVFNMEDENDRI